jgi:hypothetical protein
LLLATTLLLLLLLLAAPLLLLLILMHRLLIQLQALPGWHVCCDVSRGTQVWVQPAQLLADEAPLPCCCSKYQHDACRPHRMLNGCLAGMLDQYGVADEAAQWAVVLQL